MIGTVRRLGSLLRRARSSRGGRRSGFSAAQVGSYYDDFTPVYLEATGDFIQAFRGADGDALMVYLAASMGVADGMEILDAGCGVGAPAIWIARHFPATRVTCLTNSAAQAALTRQRVEAADLASRITVVEGDYHALDALGRPEAFDLVAFIESLGHHHDIDAVLQGARGVLRPGGRIYVKDFFRRETGDPTHEQAAETVIAAINRNYLYNVMRLPGLIAAINRNGLELRSVRAPDIVPDIGLTVAFEERAGRRTYPLLAQVHAVDWYEVLAAKAAA